MLPKNPVLVIIVVRSIQFTAVSMVLHWLLHWPLTGPYAMGLFVTPCLCLYFSFVFVAPWSWGLPILIRLPSGSSSVALTFDDGPSIEVTPQILDALAEHGVCATFFVVGQNVQRHPELVQRIVSAGHTLGIHGHTHKPFVLLAHAQVTEEMEQTKEALFAACPQAAPLVWVRPPYGFKSVLLPWIIRRSGRKMAAWSCDSKDYRGGTAEEIIDCVLHTVKPRDILLMHDGPNNQATADALPAILTSLIAAGYGCTTL